MMTVKREPYSEGKLLRIKNRLIQSMEQGSPEDYEVLVDDFKVIRRTSDPKLFDTLEEAVDQDTETITVVIYEGQSNKNSKYTFTLKEEVRKTEVPTLNGLDFKREIDERIKEERKKWEAERLKDQITELQKKNKELEDTTQRLLGELAESKEKEFSLDGIAKTAADIVGAFAKNSPETPEKIGVKTLAGAGEEVVASETSSVNSTEQEPIKIKEESPVMSEQDKAFARLFTNMGKVFSKEEIQKLAEVLEIFATDKQTLIRVHGFLTRGASKKADAPNAAAPTKEKHPAQE